MLADIANPQLNLEFPTFRKFFLSVHDHFIPHPRNNYHPHVLSHRMLALLSLLIMTVKIVAISLVAIAPAATVEASEITTPTVVNLANAARTEGGLKELKISDLLSRAAQNKADDMLAKQYFAHNTPSGDTPWTFIKAVGYSYVTAGENLAIDFTQAENIQTAWMNSPGHRANIMNPNFQEIGIGIARGMFNGHDTTIVVQMFGTPIAQKIELPSTPTPVAPQQAPTPASPAPTPVHTQSGAPVLVPISPQTQPSPASAPAPTPVSTPAAQSSSAPLEVVSAETSLQNNQLYLNVATSGPAVKVIAVYGMHSIMLDAAANDQWYGYVPTAILDGQNNLVVYAFDINGNQALQQVAEFSSKLNSANDGAVQGASIQLFGKVLNPSNMAEKVTLMILAALLACLVLAIAVRRHVQHVGLVANTAFVAMLAAFMLMV